MSDVKPMGVREAQKHETRAKILQAALTQFAAYGFDATSIRDIAADAGVNHGLITYHYAGKDELWKAAVDFLFERLAREMEPDPSFDTLSPSDQARDWLRRYVRYCASYPEHARIMVQESVRDSDKLKWAVEKHVRKNHKMSRDLIASWLEAGVFPDIPFYMIFSIVAAVAQSPFMLAPSVRHSAGVDMNNDVQIDLYTDGVIKFLLDHADPNTNTK